MAWSAHHSAVFWQLMPVYKPAIHTSTLYVFLRLIRSTCCVPLLTCKPCAGCVRGAASTCLAGTNVLVDSMLMCEKTGAWPRIKCVPGCCELVWLLGGGSSLAGLNTPQHISLNTQRRFTTRIVVIVTQLNIEVLLAARRPTKVL